MSETLLVTVFGHTWHHRVVLCSHLCPVWHSSALWYRSDSLGHREIILLPTWDGAQGVLSAGLVSTGLVNVAQQCRVCTALGNRPSSLPWDLHCENLERSPRQGCLTLPCSLFVSTVWFGLITSLGSNRPKCNEIFSLRNSTYLSVEVSCISRTQCGQENKSPLVPQSINMPPLPPMPPPSPSFTPDLGNQFP